MATALKPFVLNLSDLDFIRKQVTFRPLFDANANAIIAWDGVGPVYDSHGAVIGTGGTTAGDAASLAAIAAYGTSYASTTDLSGLRDVSGLNNNLLKVHAGWGAVDQPFSRTVEANFAGYSQAVAPSVVGSYGANNGGFDLSISQPGVQYTAATDYLTTVDATEDDGDASTIDVALTGGTLRPPGERRRLHSAHDQPDRHHRRRDDADGGRPAGLHRHDAQPHRLQHAVPVGWRHAESELQHHHRHRGSGPRQRLRSARHARPRRLPEGPRRRHAGPGTAGQYRDVHRR